MSASREKKLRQDLAAQGVTDPKLIREAEEKAKARKTNTLYGIIAALFVLVAAAVLVYNSGVLQRGKTAVVIDGEKYMTWNNWEGTDGYNTVMEASGLN